MLWIAVIGAACLLILLTIILAKVQNLNEDIEQAIEEMEAALTAPEPSSTMLN